MAVVTQTFDSGTVDAAVTTSTMGVDGAVPTAVQAGGLVYKSTAAHGARSAYCAGTIGSIRYGGLTTLTVAMSAYVRYDDVPTADSALLEVGTGGSSFVARSSLIVNSAGKVRLWDDTGATLWTAAAAISPDTWYLVELVVLVGTTTSNSTIKASYRELGDASAIGGYATTTGNAGTGSLTDLRFFRKQGPAGYVDSIAFDTASDGTLLGPWSTAPTVNVTNTPGVCVLDARGSSGTSLTYSIAPTTGVTEPVDGLFLVEQQSSSVDYTITVTQSGVAYERTETVAGLAVAGARAAYVKQSDGSWA